VIEDGVELMRLLAGGIEMAQRADIVVLLGSDGPRTVEIVGDAGFGREIETLGAAAPGIIENGIDDDVPRMQMPAEDGPNLRRGAIGIPIFRVVTEFEICAEEKFAVVGMWADKQHAKFETV